MTDEPGKDVLVPKTTVIEVDYAPIAQIIIQTCHCSVGRAEKAANLIIDHMTAVLLASGAIDVSPTGSPINERS